MAFSISFLMDIGLLVLLAATVFYAWRLNANLKNFKQGRVEMEKLVATLSVNIERAEKAIAGLQVGARNTGADLDKKIKEAKFLTDELKFMNEAGGNLATRLEKLAERNREFVEKIEASGGIGPNVSHMEPAKPPKPANEEGSRKITVQPIEEESFAGFMIQDREFVDAEAEDAFDDLDLEFENHSSKLQSQAEREFFEALQKRKPAGGRN